VTATVPLRHLAEVNPPTREFDRLGRDESVTFMPLETVWADQRVDFSRRVPKSEVVSGYTRFRDRDVLVPKVAPTFQAGRVAVATIGTPAGAGTTELHVVRSRPDISDPRFLAYVCRSAPFLAEGVSTFRGVAGLQRVPDEFVKSFPVAGMNLDEQRRIADFLDTETARIDALITKRSRQLELLPDRWRVGLDRVFDQLCSEFGERSLGRALVRMEQGTSPQCDNRPAEEHEWGVLKAGAVKGDRFLPKENKHLPDWIAPEVRYEVRPGDLLITRANTPALVGAAAVVPAGTRSRLILCDKIFRVRLDNSLRHEFVALLSQASRIRDACAVSATGASSSMVNLSARDVKQWPIPMAPVPAQTMRIRKLEAARSQQEALGLAILRQASLLSERRQALITAAVTGELDVTTARG